jgi:hypothetical protein
MNINQARETANQLHILLSYLWEDASDMPATGGIAEVSVEEADTMLALINELVEALND